MIPQRMRLVVAMVFLVPLMSANAQWKSDPSLNNTICQQGSRQHAPRIVSDGRDGAIICWYDERSGQNSFDIYVQRIDRDGFVRWTVNGVAVSVAPYSQLEPEMISDDAGGAIIAWTDGRNGNNDIYVQRVDSSGKMLWADDGLALTTDTTNQANPKIATDGKNGVIVAWNTGSGGFPPASKVHAQRVSADGTPLWSAPALVSGNFRFSSAPSICSDGSGGAYVGFSFFDRPEYDVYAQRIDANGTKQWQANGVGIATGSGTQDSPLIVADGAGNAFLTYLDWGSGSIADLHIVVLKKDGTQAAAFRATSTSGGQLKPQLSNIGKGLLGITWQDGRVAGKTRVFAQIVDTTGAKRWTANGVEVSNRAGDQVTPYIISDGADGAFVAWEDKTKGALETDIYAQRLSDAGAPLWSNAGVAVCTAGKIQQFPWIIGDGRGGAIITWEDYRSSMTNPDIYASRLLADGSFPIGPPILSFSSKTVAFGAVGIGYSSTKNITLTNTGGVPVTITSINASDPHFSLTPDNNTIDPSGSVTAAVIFQPTTKNVLNAYIVVESNSVFAPDTVLVTGYGTGSAAIQTDKTSLSFGNVKTGSTKAMALQISNTGNDTLTISSIATNSPRFTVDIASRVLAPGSSFVDTVRFTPTVIGPVSASLTLTSNASTSPTVVPLSGTGAAEVTMTIDLATISFGEVKVGSHKDTTVTIRNTGNDSLHISSFTSGNPRFTLETPLTAIGPAGVRTFTLRFTPDAAGPLGSSFTVTSNAVASPHTINVDGIGVAVPAIAFAPPQLAFGPVDLGSRKDLVLTISNPGGGSLTVTAISSSNADFSPLVQQFDVPGGGSFGDTIRFTPSLVGDRSGILTIVSNAATSPDTVLVQGTGNDPSAVERLQAFPGTFTLFQNYPNPFQSTTAIRYDLETSAPVRVTVLNSLGQVADVLVDEMQDPGMYTVQWMPRGGAPGVYFYVLRVGTHEAFGTMVLMK